MPPGNEKSNPNIALTEANAMEQWQNLGLAPNYIPFLSKDMFGNDIAEPDRSNPTRSKHERPLDTIRSFELAAYGKEFGGAPSELGLDRVDSRQSLNNYGNGAGYRMNRNSSYSAMSQMQRNYSYGNMHDQDLVDDGHSEMLQSGGPSRNVSVSNRLRDAAPNSYEQKAQGYGSPISDSGRAQFAPPPAQKLNYQTPPTPPQEQAHTPRDRRSWGKRLSFGGKK